MPIFIEGIPSGKLLSIDICEEGAYIIEGLSGVDDFTGDNEQEDCNHLEDPGVEVYKKLITLQLLTGAKKASKHPQKVSATTSLRRTESDQEGLGNRLGRTRGPKEVINVFPLQNVLLAPLTHSPIARLQD